MSPMLYVRAGWNLLLLVAYLETVHITLDAIIESNEEYDLDPRLAKSS